MTAHRVKYFVVDGKETTITIGSDGVESIRFPYEAILFTTVLPPDEVFDPPAPIRRGIEVNGWRVVQRELPPSGLNDDTFVAWREVADELAAALRALQESGDTQGSLDEVEAQVSAALDSFTIAQTEEAMRVQGGPTPEGES